jgi:cytochrome c-type biogenesis protein
MDGVSLVAAFLAGVLSFVSPCVLPLIPGYISFISGATVEQLKAGSGASGVTASRGRVLLTSVAFVAGFSLVFVSLGASASALGRLLLQQLSLLGKIAGVVIILFGLHTMGLLKLSWLYAEKRVHATRRPAGPVGAALVGIAFAFGWTPCIGPILAAILAVAATKETVGEGVRLLAAYSLGLGIPFLVTAVAIDRFFAAFARIRRHYRTIEVASGLLLVTIGVLMVTNKMSAIAQFLTPYLPTF